MRRLLLKGQTNFTVWLNILTKLARPDAYSIQTKLSKDTEVYYVQIGIFFPETAVFPLVCKD